MLIGGRYGCIKESVFMKALEVETIITEDGRLPETLHEAFGKKVKLIVLFTEDEESTVHKQGNLMSYAGQIGAFHHITDPVSFQNELRSEWNRGNA